MQKLKSKNIQNQTKICVYQQAELDKQFQTNINANLTTRKKRKNKRDNARYRIEKCSC